MNFFLILRNSKMRDLTIKSLGRMASLGGLYDARNENFLSYSLLTKDFPESLIDTKDQTSSKFRYDYSNTHESKFHNLDVSAELKLSILCGMVSLEGSGKYLSEKKENHNSVRGDLVYDITTKFQRLVLSDLNEKFINRDSIDKLASTGATHVVTGIQWGSNAIVSFTYTNDENKDKKEINGNLKAIIEKLDPKVSGSAQTQASFTEGQTSLRSKLSIEFFGDAIFKGKVPQTYEEVLHFIGDMQNLMDESNEGKGKCLNVFCNVLLRMILGRSIFLFIH